MRVHVRERCLRAVKILSAGENEVRSGSPPPPRSGRNLFPVHSRLVPSLVPVLGHMASIAWLRRLGVVLLSLVFVSTPGAAQTPGAMPLMQVVAHADGAALEGTVVPIVGTRHSAISNADGYVCLEQVPPGNQTVEVRRTGYETVRMTADLGRDATRGFTVELSEQSIKLEGVHVTAAPRSSRLAQNGFHQR